MCYPAVQHLTPSAGGGGKGHPSSPGKISVIMKIKGYKYLQPYIACYASTAESML